MLFKPEVVSAQRIGLLQYQESLCLAGLLGTER